MTSTILPPQFIYGKIIDGNGYLVNSILSLGASESANIHIRNSHEDKVMWVADINTIATGNQEFHLHDDFNSITDGDEIVIQNALMDEENGGVDSGPFEAYENSTYDSTVSYPVGFTTTDRKSADTGAISAEAVEPGREFVVEFRNEDSNTNKAYFGALILSSY